MELYEIMILVFTVAVAIAYLNHRYIGMQTSIATMSAGLIVSLLLLILGQFGFQDLEKHIAFVLSKIDFKVLLLNGMLNFLLFAGALTIDLNQLLKRKWEIGILSTLSTIASALLIGTLTYYLMNSFFHLNINFIHCLLFGALISPTDPIAVLAIIKQLNAPKQLETTIAGESLFNDGVGIVIFLTLYQVAFSGGHPTWESVSLLFVQQAVGGIAYGVFLGLLAYWLIKPIDNAALEILITLAIVTGGYTIAQWLDISGPLAMVVAGIFIGNHGRRFFMSKKTCDRLDNFWEIIDEILNIILFALIGLELLVLNISTRELVIGLIAIPMVLIVRLITVATPLSFLKSKRDYTPYFVTILTWGGLRGGLAVAMALAIPSGVHRDLILAMTYSVVIFSIIVQGGTAKHLVKLSQLKLDKRK